MDCDPYDIWRLRDDPGSFFCLHGPLSQDLLVEICDIVARKLKREHSDLDTLLKVHAVLVELSQNIIRHSAEQAPSRQEDSGGDATSGVGLIAVACHQGHYVVSSGNLLQTAQVAPLDALLERIRRLDREQLKQLFLQQRRQPSHGRRGAGLGFIDIARKASRPIEFSFHAADAGMSFFSVRVTV